MIGLGDSYVDVFGRVIILAVTECKLLEQLWRTIWQYLVKSKIFAANLVITLLDIILENFLHMCTKKQIRTAHSSIICNDKNLDIN